jgi:phosphatidylglycerol:prolipoprotein diacylglycerol transferase
MLPYVFQSTSLTIGSYGLMLAIAYLVGRWYFLKQLTSRHPKLESGEVLIIMLLVFGVVGAKLMFVAKNSDSMHLLTSGTGFSSQGALLGAILASIVYARTSGVKFSTLLDTGAPAAILAYALARVGCFLSGDDCHGLPTELPWGMSFPNGIAATIERVHPVPLYEIAYALAIFVFLKSRFNEKSQPYSAFFTLFLLWGICRFLVEFVSANPKLLFGFSGSQVGAAIMVLISIVFFATNKSRQFSKQA